MNRSRWLWKIRKFEQEKKSSSFLTYQRTDAIIYKIFDKTSRPACNHYKPEFDVKFK